MDVRRLRFGVLTMSLILGGCASAGSSSAGAAATADALIPPRMKSSPSMIKIPGRFSGTIDVPVDATGRADILRMRVTGRMTDDVRRAFTEFFEQSTFVPAMMGGVPVAGVFQMKMRLR